MNQLSAERRIVNRLVSHALAAGLRVSVYDGEETVVEQSSNRDLILAEMFTTDQDRLTFYTVMGLRTGSVLLIYGNGNDVIADYSAPDLDAFTSWLQPVADYAEKA